MSSARTDYAAGSVNAWSRRATRWWYVVLAGAVAGCSSLSGGTPSPVETTASVRFPRDAARFALQPLTDSTATFESAEASWVRVGAEGIAVDPTRGDALVARLRVVVAGADTAMVLVTGQTTRVSSGHVLLLVRPRTPWWRDKRFWWGAVSGIAVTGGVVTFL